MFDFHIQSLVLFQADGNTQPRKQFILNLFFFFPLHCLLDFRGKLVVEGKISCKVSSV